MRQEVKDRLSSLLLDKRTGGWKDGWVWGRLKQEFTLTPEELSKLATTLGYKFGWNSIVEEIFVHQWQENEVKWLAFESRNVERSVAYEELKFREVQKTARQQQIRAMYQDMAAFGQPISNIEQQLINSILSMSANEQLWLLKQIFNRQKSKLRPIPD